MPTPNFQKNGKTPIKRLDMRGGESRFTRIQIGKSKGTGGIAQWIEQRFSKPLVEGSSPPAPGLSESGP